MPNSPSQMFLDMLKWRQIWGSGNDTPYHHTSCGSGVSLQSKGRSPQSPLTNTIGITADIQPAFVAKDYLVPFRCSSVSSCAGPLQMEASMGGHHGQHT
ncbi:hypothetical protein TNCV_37541 [Trichonephila clavipes]|nr:hypothetical protein TNCV_37541 [Trichonephila clavipes]